MRLDWAEEKQRLLRLLLALLAGTICLFCSLLSLGALVLIVSWNTPYQHAALYALVGFFCTGTLAAGYCLHRLVLQGSEAFADTRAELSADLALIRSKLGE
ncbi:MAG: phage holin family protein, partial [Pseudomonadota bacterium]